MTLVALAGCGGGDDDGGSDEEEVVETVKGFYASIVEGDSAAACEALTEEGLQEVLDSATGFAQEFDCEEVVTFISDGTDEETKQKILEAEPTVSEITDSTAVVETPTFNTDINTGEVEESTGDFELEKVGDEWKVGGLPN